MVKAGRRLTTYAKSTAEDRCGKQVRWWVQPSLMLFILSLETLPLFYPPKLSLKNSRSLDEKLAGCISSELHELGSTNSEVRGFLKFRVFFFCLNDLHSMSQCNSFRNPKSGPILKVFSVQSQVQVKEWLRPLLHPRGVEGRFRSPSGQKMDFTGLLPPKAENFLKRGYGAQLNFLAFGDSFSVM